MYFWYIWLLFFTVVCVFINYGAWYSFNLIKRNDGTDNIFDTLDWVPPIIILGIFPLIMFIGIHIYGRVPY